MYINVKRLIFWATSAALIAIFIRAGCWQLDRETSKRVLIERTAQVLKQRQRQSLPSQIDALEKANEKTDALMPEWVSISGMFLPDQLLLDSQRRGQQVGVQVYQRFQPEGSNQTIFIELGWLAMTPDRTLPRAVPLNGAHRFEGLWLAPPSAGFAIGDALQPQSDGQLLALRFDRQALAQRFPNTVTDAVVRPDPAWQQGYARDLNVLPNTLSPDKHRAYAVQWFGLAAALAVITIYMSLRRR